MGLGEFCGFEIKDPDLSGKVDGCFLIMDDLQYRVLTDKYAQFSSTLTPEPPYHL